MTALRASFALLVVLLASQRAARGVDIRLRERVDVRGRYIRLADVAVITGADRRQARLLTGERGRGGVFLGPAPRVLSRSYILLRIEAAGVRLSGVRVSGAQAVTVTRAGRGEVARMVPLGVARSSSMPATRATESPFLEKRRERRAAFMRALEAPARDTVSRRTGWALEDVAAECLSVNVSSERIPAGAFRVLDTSVRGVRNARDYIGDITLVFDLDAGGRTMRNVSAVFRVERWTSVVYARRDIARRTDIQPQDLELRRALVGHADGRVFTRVEDLHGQPALQDIPKGERITRPMVRLLPMVRSGQGVIVEVGAVRRRARALRDGFAGDYIRVRYEVGGRPVGDTVVARVERPGVVVLDLNNAARDTRSGENQTAGQPMGASPKNATTNRPGAALYENGAVRIGRVSKEKR